MERLIDKVAIVTGAEIGPRVYEELTTIGRRCAEEGHGEGGCGDGRRGKVGRGTEGRGEGGRGAWRPA